MSIFPEPLHRSRRVYLLETDGDGFGEILEAACGDLASAGQVGIFIVAFRTHRVMGECGKTLGSTLLLNNIFQRS